MEPAVEQAAVAPVPAQKPAPSETARVQTVIPIVTALAEQPTQALAPASGPEAAEPGPNAGGGIAENQSSSTLTGYSDETEAGPSATPGDTGEGSGAITSVSIIGKQVYVTRAKPGSPAAAKSPSASAAQPTPLEPASGAAPDAETAAPAQETTLALAAPLPADTAPASQTKASGEAKQPADATTAATPSPSAPVATAAVGSSMQAPSPALGTGTAGAVGGEYYVQLAAVRSEAATATEWKRLQSLHRHLLAGLSLNVVRTDLGERGVFYRIQAGALSEAAAQDLCAEILKTNAQCFVVKP
jgi:hypothetical protein